MEVVVRHWNIVSAQCSLGVLLAVKRRTTFCKVAAYVEFVGVELSDA